MSIFKNFPGSMPPAPLESFLLLSLNCLKLTLPEKTTHEKVAKFGAPSLIKNFLNNILAFLYLANIPPDSKSHAPPH